MSSRGHRRAGSRTGGKLARRTPCDVRRALTRATETAVVPLLAKRRARRSGRLPSCRDRPSVPSRRVALALVVESVARLRTPFSPPSPREPASAGRARNFGASVTPPIRLAALRVARRAMRRTDFCHLTSSYEHPRPVGSRRVACWCTRDGGESPASHQSDSLRRAALHSRGHRGGPCPPIAMCYGRASDIPVAALEMDPALARVINVENRRDRRSTLRVNESDWKRSGTPSFRQGPLPRNALSSIRLRPPPTVRLGHRAAGYRRLWLTRILSGAGGSDSRARAPLPVGIALLEVWATLVDFCNLNGARAHPTSVRSSHASGAFAPLLAGTNRCRLRWLPQDVAASRACKPRTARDGSTRAAFHLRGKDEFMGWSARAKANARCGTSVPSSQRPWHPVMGATRRESWTSSRLVAPIEIPRG